MSEEENKRNRGIVASMFNGEIVELVREANEWEKYHHAESTGAITAWKNVNNERATRDRVLAWIDALIAKGGKDGN